MYFSNYERSDKEFYTLLEQWSIHLQCTLKMMIRIVWIGDSRHFLKRRIVFISQG